MHPPDSAPTTLPATKQIPSRAHADIPTQLLVDYLTASDTATFQRLKSQLPSGFYRIDAYLLLRERDPQSLSTLSYFDIYSLINAAGLDNLGGVLALLLQDIIGSDMSNPKAKPGFFQVFAGTEERYKLLREILVRCNQSDFLLHDGTALNVFLLMLDDLIQLRQSGADGSKADIDAGTNSSGGALSVAEGAPISLPSNFPVGETRKLVKLAVQVHRPELAPILNALRAHLEAHTPDFPTAREGAQLIAYYLQPNLRDFASALDVVRGFKDTNALAQEVIDDAIRDGKTYLAELEALFSSESEHEFGRPSQQELQQICMDVSLRLVAMKSIMAQRSKGGVQYRKAFESLMASFRFDLVDSHQSRQGDQMRSLLDVPFRSIRTILLNLVGQNDKSSLTEAVFLLQRCDQRLVAMLPHRDLQDFCDTARAQDAMRLATDAYSQIVKAKTTTPGLPLDCKHILARDGLMTDTSTFLVIMRVLRSHGQKIAIVALLRALRILPLTDHAVVQLNLRFSAGQRPRLVALFARVGLTTEAFDLFQLWTHWRYSANADTIESATLRRAGSVQVADPLIERQIRLMYDPDRQVAISSQSLLALVRGFCHQPATKSTAGSLASGDDRSSNETSRPSGISPDQLRKARFVIDVFKQSCTPIDWTHYRLTSLAQACFIAEDVAGAFDALAKISFLREIPDQVDISVLLGGLVEHDADKAVDLFIRHCSVPEVIGSEERTSKGRKKKAETKSQEKLPTLAPMKPTPLLTSVLLKHTIAQGRMDLAGRLYKFSQAVGIASRLGTEAALHALLSQDAAPSQMMTAVARLLQRAWTADPAVLERMAQQLLTRSMQRRPGTESETPSEEDHQEVWRSESVPVPLRERLPLIEAAVHLMQVSARNKDVVNLRTVSRALTAIARARHLNEREPIPSPSAGGGVSATSGRSSKQRDPEGRRLELIAFLDSIVHLLRWTQFFDTGDDYRHSLPLWKASTASDGELVSSELGEMLEHGFVGSHRRQPRVRTSGAAATLPTPADALPDDGAESADGKGRTNGVVQQSVARTPNALPARWFRRLIETYLALGDAAGAAEVASWMRDEAKVDLPPTPDEATEFVTRIKAAVLNSEANRRPGPAMSSSVEAGSMQSPAEGSVGGGSNILRMLAGQQITAHTKSWWAP